LVNAIIVKTGNHRSPAGVRDAFYVRATLIEL
jgi:hypothetical protein